MPNNLARSAIVVVLTIVSAIILCAYTPPKDAWGAEPDIESYTATLKTWAEDILRSKCGVCHGPKDPKADLDLSSADAIAASLNAPSTEIPSLKIIDLQDPARSYLIMKIRGEEGIMGQPMPINAPPLEDGEIYTINLWIYSLHLSEPGNGKPDESEKKKD
jgi:hypothetical protein